MPWGIVFTARLREIRRPRKIARNYAENCNLWRRLVLLSLDRLKSGHRAADIEP